MAALILLVDDNAIQAATRKAILTRSGRSVMVASCGDQALQMMAETTPARPVRLVITDHLMPGMDGPTFVSELRRLYPRVPVLVLSGLADAEDEYQSLDVTFRGKPLPPEEMLELVRVLLNEPIAKTA